MALVSQNVHLFNDTVANNIAYARTEEYSREQIEEAARMAYAMDFINKMDNGLDTIIGENGVMLSGGQRQRIAIARALLRNSPILILDEATSALDTESERAIQAALDELQKTVPRWLSLTVCRPLSRLMKSWWLKTGGSWSAERTMICWSIRACTPSCIRCNSANDRAHLVRESPLWRLLLPLSAVWHGERVIASAISWGGKSGARRCRWWWLVT